MFCHFCVDFLFSDRLPSVPLGSAHGGDAATSQAAPGQSQSYGSRRASDATEVPHHRPHSTMSSSAPCRALTHIRRTARNRGHKRSRRSCRPDQAERVAAQHHQEVVGRSPRWTQHRETATLAWRVSLLCQLAFTCTSLHFWVQKAPRRHGGRKA